MIFLALRTAHKHVANCPLVLFRCGFWVEVGALDEALPRCPPGRPSVTTPSRAVHVPAVASR